MPDAKVIAPAVEVIRRDEVGHVLFGSRWYRTLCAAEGLDPDQDFGTRLWRLFAQLPRRMEPIHAPLRAAAGFSAQEITDLENFRGRWKS